MPGTKKQDQQLPEAEQKVIVEAEKKKRRDARKFELKQERLDLKKIFADSLNNAINARLNAHNPPSKFVVSKLGLSVDEKALTTWRSEKGGFPREPAELMELAKKLNVSLDSLFGLSVHDEPAPLGNLTVHFGHDRTTGRQLYQAALKRMVKDADQIWFLCRTGVTLTEWDDRKDVRNRMVNNSLKVRLLLTTSSHINDFYNDQHEVIDPEFPVPNEQAKHFWAQYFAGIRRDDWDPEPLAVEGHIRGTIHMFTGYAQDAEIKAKENSLQWDGQLNIRTMPYPPSMCIYIAQGKKGGKAVFMPFNFQEDVFVAPIFEVDEQDNNSLFKWLVEDYNRHWNWKANTIIRDDES